MLDPVGIVIVGIIVLVFHFYLKLNMKYFDSLDGSKNFEQHINLNTNENKKLSFREKTSIFSSKIIKLLIILSRYIGFILIITGVIIKIFLQIIL